MIELMSDPKHRDSMKKRLARIEGQLRGVQKLMDDTSDCEKILQQLTAARKALDKAFFEMMACVIEHNVVGGVVSADMANEASEDMVQRMSEVRLLLSRYA